MFVINNYIKVYNYYVYVCKSAILKVLYVNFKFVFISEVLN